MKTKNLDHSESELPKFKNPLIYNHKICASALDKSKQEIKKYQGSFNSNPDPQQFVDKNINPFEIDNDLTTGPVLSEAMCIIRESSTRFSQIKASQSFTNTDNSQPLSCLEISNSKSELRLNEQHKKVKHESQEETPHKSAMPAESKLETKKKCQQMDKNANPISLNDSHFDKYMRNHPMERKVHENEERFHKALDKNSLNVQNNYMKQKISLMKNFETKISKKEGPSSKITALPTSVTVLNIKSEISRASTKQKTNNSTSENKNNPQQFYIFNKPDEKIFKKKVDRKVSELDDVKKKPKNEHEFNHVFKILDFLDKDASLKLGRKKIQDKMKDLGRESFNETNKKSNQLDQLNETNFQKEFKIKGVLGKGSYGEVRLCENEKTNEYYAVKIYPKKFLKDKIKKQNINNEKEILMSIEHDNIIKLYRVVEGVQSIYFLTEYAGKASLHEVLSNTSQTTFTEDDARPIIAQLCQAILYLHEENIIHRDIKLHNILVNDEDQLKLIDFGFALKLAEGELIEVFCGTPSYMSPEIVNRKPYDGKAADVWALGVCAYRMIVGTFPFRGFLISINGRRPLQKN